MIECTRRSGGARKGQMPMALIAVALLIAGAFYGMVYAGIERSGDNADSANVEFATVDDAVQRAELTIESELGRIVNTISAVKQGTLIERSESFGTLSEQMLGDRFPNTYKGVTTEIEDHHLKLSLENMRLGTGLGSASKASFLRVSGTVDIVLTSESTVTRKTLSIDADATSALPLVAEASTMFELSTEGGGSALSQMVEYQLNALACNRVMNGYGMRSSYGEFGTASIITQNDVIRALNNGLNILEAMYFRDCPDGELLVHSCADLGDLIVLQDGCLVIDLGALFSQAVLQRVDEYAVQWMDYIGADAVLDLVDFAIDALHNVWNMCCRVLTGEDPDKKEAVKYIKRQMDELGYSQDDYRYFEDDDTKFRLTVREAYVESDDGDMLKVDGIDEIVCLYDVDLLDWDGWGDFMRDYRERTNPFKETLRDTLTAIALESCKGCTVRIPVSAFDRDTYADEVERCVDAAVNGSMDRFVTDSVRTIRSCGVSDPVMNEMYREICEHRYEIFGVDEDDLLRSLSHHLCHDIPLGKRDPAVDGYIRDQLTSSGSLDSIKATVDRWVEHLSIFQDAKKKCNIADQLAATAGGILRKMDLQEHVRGVAVTLAREMAEAVRINPYSTVTDLPGSDRFEVYDGAGTRYTETLTVSDSRDIDITITDPMHNGGRNTHYVGFFEDRVARYSSVFTVSVKGTVGYQVTSANPLYEGLGITDCVYAGTIDIDMQMSIACMSGWALAGTDYEKSNTLLGDVSDALQMILERIMEVLRKPLEMVMAGLERIVNAATTAIVEFGNYLNTMMQRYYDAIAVPLEFLQSALDTVIQEILGSVALEDVCIMLGSQTFVFDIFGMRITVDTNLRSLSKSSKDFVRITAERELGDATLTASVAIKENARAGRYALISGGASGGDWAFDLELDPLMAAGSSYATISGHTRDIDYHGSIPELVQYQILDVSTNDVPGLRESLNNIVLPAIGYKASIEIGLYAKYDLPMESGVLINEVELNPEGNDTDAEWAEILNNTDSTVDLLGYTLAPSGADKKAVSIGDVVLAPHQRTVVYFQGQALKNDGAGTKLVLFDTYGNTVDRTPSLKDKDNDDRTWQRDTDGSVNWSFLPSTEDGKNGGNVPGAAMLKTLLIDFAKDAAVEVLDEMGDRVEGAEQAMEYAERVIARVVEKFIDCVARCIVEACAFIRFEMTDYSQSQHFGMKVMLGVDSQIISDTLRYLATMIPVIGEHIAAPEGLAAEDIIFQDVYLRTMVYTGMSAPKILGGALDGTEVDGAVSVRYNLSAVAHLFGQERGRWQAEAGILFENIPTQMVPEKLDPRPYMKSDLWVFRMTFTEGENRE